MHTTEANLLIVDNEPNVRELLSASLRFAGFQVTTSRSGTEAAQAVARDRPDLVVLDVLLPDMDGYTVLRQLRDQSGRSTGNAAHDRIPIIFLTAQDGADDKIKGLTAGVDDYVTKPFSLEELIARIRAVLRRSGRVRTAPDRLTVADLELDLTGHQVLRAGQPVSLSPTEFKLLAYLMTNTGRVVSKLEILDQVWTHDFNGDLNIIESYISYLRRKIDPDTPESPKLIHTLRGVGYVLRLQPA